MFELAEAFRRRGKLVVAGGFFATLCPEELRGKVDVLVVGEAECTWPRFVRDHEAGAWRFIQQARIPISMIGMLNALPKTPLDERLRATGRLIAESVGDQFVFTNIVPGGMSRLELYEGYRALLRRLYGYRAYRRPAMDFILSRGPAGGRRLLTRRDDLAVVARIAWTCMLRASPRRAWLTRSMCLETALRRPRAMRDAFTLALMHKHFYEYVRETSKALDGLIRELREAEPAP